MVLVSSNKLLHGMRIKSIILVVFLDMVLQYVISSSKKGFLKIGGCKV
jgi:hypothetical protein